MPDEFTTGLVITATADVTHPPAESMTAAERAHLGIGDPTP